MSKISLSIHVEARPELVFAVASDFANAAENIQGIEKLEILSDGPIGVGTRFRETRKMFGKESTEEMEITNSDPPNGYTVECESCGALMRSEFNFIEENAGTRIQMEMDCQPLTFFAKLMSPLSGLMMGPMKKLMVADFEDLKRVAERKAST